MSIRTRKLVGAVALLALVIVWGLLAMALAQSVLTNINGWVATIYYIVAGLGWVLPALALKLAVDGDARQRGQIVAVYLEQHARPRRQRGLEAEFGRNAEFARAG